MQTKKKSGERNFWRTNKEELIILSLKKILEPGNQPEKQLDHYVTILGKGVWKKYEEIVQVWN